MKMEIYGFKADIKRDGKLFVGTIDELHIQDQANLPNSPKNSIMKRKMLSKKYYLNQSLKPCRKSLRLRVY